MPDISAWSALDELLLWQALERENGAPVDPPFFAVPWPGAQALARAVLDGVVEVKGAVVADVGCGSGVACVAAMLRGAKRALAVDVDGLATQSARLLAARHGVCVDERIGDALSDAGRVIVDDADVIFAGDLVSSARHVDGFKARVAAWRAQGKRVVLADSGRPFFDPCGARCVAVHDVSVPRGVEGTTSRTVWVYL